MLADLDRKVELCNFYEGRIRRCPEDLDLLLHIHRDMWRDGIRNQNLGTGSMFCCRDITRMSLDDVYLGNICGIWTNKASFFESMRHSEPDVYRRIVQQYRDHLLKGVEYERDLVYDGGVCRIGLEHWVADVFSKHLNTKVSVKIACPFLSENAVIPCRLRYRGHEVSSSFLLMGKSQVLFPKDFEKGIIIDSRNFSKIHFSSRMCGFEPMSYYYVSEKDFKFLPDISSKEEIGRKELKRIHKGLGR